MSARREFLIGLGAALAWSLPARSQLPRTMYRIGFLGNSTAALEANLIEPFRQGLRDLGYEEGRNITIEYRWAEGKYERLPALIAELVALNLDVMVTAGTPAALAVKKAAISVPLVIAAIADPVGTGVVPSLARPAGNITGLSAMATDLEGKRLQLLAREGDAGINARAVRSPLLPTLQGHESEVYGCCGPMAIPNCTFSTQ